MAIKTCSECGSPIVRPDDDWDIDQPVCPDCYCRRHVPAPDQRLGDYLAELRETNPNEFLERMR